jgi:hypothetical protein
MNNMKCYNFLGIDDLEVRKSIQTKILCPEENNELHFSENIPHDQVDPILIFILAVTGILVILVLLLIAQYSILIR